MNKKAIIKYLTPAILVVCVGAALWVARRVNLVVQIRAEKTAKNTADSITRLPKKLVAQTQAKELAGLLNQIEIRSPHRHANLTIFFITLRQQQKEKFDVLTLDEAVHKGYVVIGEIGRGTVAKVELENRSEHYVFLMGGELLTGCKQDRMVAKDTLVPPHSGKIKLEVYCTEHGRWVPKTMYFDAPPHAAPARIRGATKNPGEQSEVWRQIDDLQGAVRARSVTGGLNVLFTDAHVKSLSESYTEYFIDIPKELKGIACGAIVAINDKIVCVDVFYSAKLFDKLWRKLLKSYVLEAIAIKGEREAALTPLTVKDANLFLAEVCNASYERADSEGVGRLIKIKSDEIIGSALAYIEILLHLELFPKHEAKGPAGMLLTPSQRQQAIEP